MTNCWSTTGKEKWYMQNNLKTRLDMHSNPQMRSRLQVFWSIVTVEVVGLMLRKDEEAILLPLLWHASRSCFCAISPKRIYLWTALNQFLEWIVSKISSPYDSRAAKYELWRFEFSQKTNYWSTTGKEKLVHARQPETELHMHSDLQMRSRLQLL